MVSEKIIWPSKSYILLHHCCSGSFERFSKGTYVIEPMQYGTGNMEINMPTYLMHGANVMVFLTFLPDSERQKTPGKEYETIHEVKSRINIGL